MTGSSTFERLTRDTLDEHGHIHFFLDQLQHSLDSLGPDSTEEQVRRLAAHLESLRERLEEHHATEEKDGLFQGIVDAIPGAATDVHHLSNEHDRMIEILEMARIHAQRCDASDAGDLRTELESFLQLMRAHEKKEEALLERALEEESRTLT